MNEQRLSIAREVGADVTLNTEKDDVFKEVRKLTGVGADIVIAAVGLPAVIEKYLPLVRNGGVFNIFGGTPPGQTITLDPRWLHYGEIILTGTFAASLNQFRKAFGLVQDRASDIAKVVSVRCRLDDILEAVERVKNGSALKSIIMFD
jgi:threonine dehydrogenase-like Zn-dependent dehydrogenase